MPFKAPETPKCPKCTKSVYHAEARVVGDISFHKECYKCSMCNKMLDSTNANCHEKVLFCKVCHGRKYGPKGYGFGGGAAGLSMDTGAHLEKAKELAKYTPPKAAPGEGCPRCGGKVYAAEEMLAKGRSYHKTCFNCKNCRKPLDSMVHCDGPDKDVYCKVCYGKKYGPHGYGYGGGAGTLTCSNDPDQSPIVRPHGNPDAIIPAGEGEQPCPRCGGRVYMAELMMAKGRPFHKKCFKCRQCKRPLDSMVHCDSPDGEVYCKLCYAKKYGPKGYGFAAGAGGVLVAENIPGGETKMPGVPAGSAVLDVSKIRAEEGKGCPRCGGKVFMAEEINARGRPFHKRCYNCLHCHRPLDSMVGCDAPDGEVYCKLCYAKKYGPKGYGFAAGSGGVLVAENIVGGDENAEMKKLCASGSIDTSKIQAAKGKGCPRCGGKVFMAEEIHVRDRSYHKRCYNCRHCHRPLDSMVGCDSPDGEVYCKLCYAKKYGPKGYGFAAGSGGVLVAENIPGGATEMPGVTPAHAAIDTRCIQAAPGEGCPRCGGKVFGAEERLSRNKKWHKRCYNCLDCTRPLDSMVLCDGPDGEIYCKLCYAKRFGPKGYGFAAGAGGVLVPENIDSDDVVFDPDKPIISRGPAFSTPDVTLIQAREGQSRCPRCGGAVFQAESMPCKGKEWHKKCYNCCVCHRPLDSMLACDAPDGEIYCKLCYAKCHGPKGYGYGHQPALVSLGSEDGLAVPTDIRQFGFGAKAPKNWVPPIATVNQPNQVHGPPSSMTPSVLGGPQEDMVPIESGDHEGEAVSIVSGLVQGPSKLMPDIPTNPNRMSNTKPSFPPGPNPSFPADPNHGSPAYPDQSSMTFTPSLSQEDMANMQPEMLGEMLARQATAMSEMAGQASAMSEMALQQSQLAQHISQHQSGMSTQQTVVSSHHQQSMSVQMQQMRMTSEFSSEPQPMLDPPSDFEHEPEYDPQSEFEDVYDEEAMHEAAITSEYDDA